MAEEEHHGFWTPQRGGGWAWHEGGNPPQSLIDTYGRDTLTNYTQAPNGAANPNYDPDPGPDDVNPPTLTQIWQLAPDIPGEFVFFSESGTGTPPTTIPTVAAFTVVPGDLRAAENTLLTETNTQVTGYMGLRTSVLAFDWRKYGLSWHDAAKMKSMQDNMLVGVAESIHAVGVYVGKLNDAAQLYAKADYDSIPPDGQ